MTETLIVTILSPLQIAATIDLLHSPGILIPTLRDYPSHKSWIKRTETDLESGAKRATTAFMGKKAIGTIIYYLDYSSGVAGIRNISIHPEYRRQHLATQLLAITENEIAKHCPGGTTIETDTKVSNDIVIHFLTSRGYNIRETKDLYGEDTDLDVVLEKIIAS